MLTCDICHQSFSANATSNNPGTTYVSGFSDNPSKVISLYVCDACLPNFYAQGAEEQQAQARQIKP